MPNPNVYQSESKFTRGEKCIFVHLIVTFALIVLLIIIYFVHLCIADHTTLSALKISRKGQIRVENTPIGIVFLNSPKPKFICNTLLLKKFWSLAPGHCVAMRSDPDMVALLTDWRIKYRRSTGDFEIQIKRSIPHPKFNRDDFSNNIGVLQHVTPVNDFEDYVFPDKFAMNFENPNMSVLIGWEWNDIELGEEDIIKHQVIPVPLEKCIHFVSAIVDLRSYEFCMLVRVRSTSYPNHGAIFAMDTQLLGFFSWGEKTARGFPYIILDIVYFRKWIENVISL